MRPHGYCPFCKQEDKTVKHILHCQHQNTITMSEEALNSFLIQMLKIRTCSSLLLTTTIELITWRNNNPVLNTSWLPTETERVITAQRKIG